jgi:hypothetical protein
MIPRLREWCLRVWATVTNRHDDVEEELRFHLKMAEEAALIVAEWLNAAKGTEAIKVGWEHARKRAGLETVRVHDLRHTGVSRMIAARIPLPVIARIVGWSAGTLAKMAARYGHFSIEEMRSALESIGGGPEEISAAYPKKFPKSGREEKANMALDQKRGQTVIPDW